jgi:thiol-disulfide isomerase/thioredoxin
MTNPRRRYATAALLLLLLAGERPNAREGAADAAPGTAAAGAATAGTPAAALSGLWDATVDVGVIRVPFRLGIAVEGDRLSGWFFNGAQRVRSTAGTLNSGHLVLEFPSYARRLDLQQGADGTLSGGYGSTTPGTAAPPLPIFARRALAHAALPASAGEAVPDIAGLWIIPTESRKAGEKAWRFIARQSGAQVSAAILRVDGDSGALTGTWDDGKVVLSHFDGARPALLEVSTAPQGTLRLVMRGADGVDRTRTAYRPRTAAQQGLPAAADPTRHTGMQDATEAFRFRFPDLEGRVVANTDARFRGRVLVIDVMGSWCPNCHDEAPLLEALYRRYRRRGLEVVTLAFEEPEQLSDPQRLRAFVRDFGLDYTVLLAGTPDELHQKLPQARGLDAYPTTFFVGRDGRVRAVHAGFAAPATGEFNLKLRKEFTSTIERLLAEKG